MNHIHLVALLALVQYIVFASLVGRARAIHGVRAPAVQGVEAFERIYRVQMNTLELLVAFLPALYIASAYWPSALVAGLGTVYLLGRLVYWRAYVADPAKRGLGYLLSMGPVMLLVGLGAWGALKP